MADVDARAMLERVRAILVDLEALGSRESASALRWLLDDHAALRAELVRMRDAQPQPAARAMLGRSGVVEGFDFGGANVKRSEQPAAQSGGMEVRYVPATSPDGQPIIGPAQPRLCAKRTEQPTAEGEILAGHEQPAARTVRVRLYVAMDGDGDFACSRFESSEDFDWLEERYSGHRVSIIEADVPLPEEPATVQGRVVEGGSDGR